MSKDITIIDRPSRGISDDLFMKYNGQIERFISPKGFFPNPMKKLKTKKCHRKSTSSSEDIYLIHISSEERRLRRAHLRPGWIGAESRTPTNHASQIPQKLRFKTINKQKTHLIALSIILLTLVSE